MTMGKVSAKKAVLVMVVIALIAAYALLVLGGPDDSPQERRVRLLCRTDHEALLAAGREILRKAPKDLMKYVIGRPIHIDGIPVPMGVLIPRAIRKLRPHAVLINLEGYVVLHMGQGTPNYGVKIYPEGFKTPRDSFRYGHRELLPGLWYYDYKYAQDPQYNERIDEVIKTGEWGEHGSRIQNTGSRTQKGQASR